MSSKCTYLIGEDYIVGGGSKLASTLHGCIDGGDLEPFKESESSLVVGMDDSTTCALTHFLHTDWDIPFSVATFIRLNRELDIGF